jgi:hypothetical protein
VSTLKKCNKKDAGETKRMHRTVVPNLKPNPVRSISPRYERKEGLSGGIGGGQETLLDPRLDDLQESRILQIGTRFGIRKVLALLGPGFMDCTAFAHAIVGKQDTGTVLSGFKGVFIFKKTLSRLTVSDTEIAGNAVDIFRPNK